MLITEDGLVIDARSIFRGRLQVPWASIRKAVIDDGSRWGYVSEVCRFPVYATRPDDSGAGALIGPLWSTVSSLMPSDCPFPAVDPVPSQAPNLALIFEPQVFTPSMRGDNAGNGAAALELDSIAGMLLLADDPDAARATLAPRVDVGDLGLDDLDYLNGTVETRHSGNGALDIATAGNGASDHGTPNGSGNGASGNGSANGSGNGASAPASASS